MWLTGSSLSCVTASSRSLSWLRSSSKVSCRQVSHKLQRLAVMLQHADLSPLPEVVWASCVHQASAC